MTHVIEACGNQEGVPGDANQWICGLPCARTALPAGGGEEARKIGKGKKQGKGNQGGERIAAISWPQELLNPPKSLQCLNEVEHR